MEQKQDFLTLDTASGEFRKSLHKFIGFPYDQSKLNIKEPALPLRIVNPLRIALLYLVVISLLYSCNNAETAHLKIDFNNDGNYQGFLEEQRVSGTKFLDSLDFSSKNRFSYKFDLDQPTFYNLRFRKNRDLFLLIHPTDKVLIKGDIDNFEIIGSEDSKKLKILYDSLFATRKTLEVIRAKFNGANAEQRETLTKEYEAVFSGYHRFSMQFILDNLTSMVSLAAIYQETNPGEFVFGSKRDMQFFKLVSDSLTKKYPKHRHVLALKRNFRKIMETYQVEKLIASATSIEEGIPELLLPSVSGDSLALSSMKNKYVLLNFWSQEVTRSQTYFPQLKDTYARFSPKGFSIYNVYLGKSVDTWKKILKFEDIDAWINVADTNFPFSKTKGSYNINSLPSNYLVDIKNNEILGKDLSSEQLKRSLSIKLE